MTAPTKGGLTLRQRLALLLGISAAVLTIASVILFSALDTLGSQREAVVVDIDPAALAARDLRTALVDQETGVRGFVITGDPDFLRAKTEELIRNPAWQADPSIGYLNAFDVLVHVKATASTPLLSGLIQMKDRKDLAHAGFLTLDRLVQGQPVDVLTRLAADTALQQGRPEMVAQQFARADLRDPAQQALVKNWLLDPARSAAELRSFAGVYPNNNQFVSSPPKPPRPATISRPMTARP